MGCTHSKTHARKKDAASIGKLPVVMETTWSDIGLQFVPGEVSINEYGIAYYNFDGFNPADSHQEIHVCKRYSEFKSLYVDMCKLIRKEDKCQMSSTLPSMPPANAVTFVLGRGNEIVVKAREAQFLKLLNAMASHPIASQSKLFTRFIE